MAVITISRLHGVGGRHFGRRLAERLGCDYVDKELLSRVADRLGRGEEEVSLYEDTGPGPSTPLLAVLARKYPVMSADIPDVEEYAVAVAEILKELAGKGRVVIVGRGGQAVLAGTPGVLHLRLVADDGYRVARLAGEGRYEGLREEEILRKIHHQSDVREEFVRRHFGVDWADPLNYHLVVNMGRLSAPEAEELIVDLVRRREGAGESSSTAP